MKPLSIDKALQLYRLLAPYLPDEEDDGFKFVGTIIENIKISGNHKVYIESISLMAELSFEEVLQYDPKTEALQMFIEGLIENKIIGLENFCKRIGYNG